jgi:glutathione peroxidase
VNPAIETIGLKTADGKSATIGDHAEKVRLVVNVASKCGLTPQYAALEAVYRKYKARGFEVLAFPANEFGGQEPGTEAEITAFCTTTYDVTFPLFAKIVVKGRDQHPLYAALTKARPEARSLPGSEFRAKLASYGIPAGEPSEVLWNFEKFVLDRNGAVIDRFAPDVPPDDPLVISVIEAELAKPASSR